MTESTTAVRCPKCDKTLANGYLTTEQMAGAITNFPRCSDIIWCDEFKMGFTGKPHGVKVSTNNTEGRYVAIPAMRCTECRMIIFKY